MSLPRSAIVVSMLLCLANAVEGQAPAVSYDQVRAAFAEPDHAKWGEVPLWWWEGDRLDKGRVRWQLETLAAQGVKSICPIQRSPARCDPASFTPEWWEMFEYVHQQCQRLGMTLWAYDQIGYGHYGWLEKAAAQTQDPRTGRVVLKTADATPDQPAQLELPEGKLLGARAYPLRDSIADDETSLDLSKEIQGRTFTWKPTEGSWRVVVSIVVSEPVFQLSETAADTFLDMLYGEVERRLGREAMGTSFAGMFQDEHPPTPRDVMTPELAKAFRERFGYSIARAIPALHFDVGPLTAKYRSDFFDAYLDADEQCYWKRVYDWTESRGILTSHDNWGRNNIVQQSLGYIDYFRTQRWFSAPGYDDAGQAPIVKRNYYDTKIASSLARLYQRPRVWSESFHSSGWGRTTNQTLTWLSANYVFGANLYDEHGLYYSARASTWEHAAPDPHWRQPYWRYYHHLSDWVARTSYMMGQGTHVVDAAVHYPVVSLLAGKDPGESDPDYNEYMRLSRSLFDAAIDNDIIDDDSILSGQVKDGKLIVAGNGYQALVFGRERTMRRGVLRKAIELVESGGSVIFFGSLPTGSTDAGRDDPELRSLLETLLGVSTDELAQQPVVRRVGKHGCAAFVPRELAELAPLVTQSIDRDVIPRSEGLLFVTHRRVGSLDVYLLQNPTDKPLDLEADFRASGVPELWDAFTGEVGQVDAFRRSGPTTRVRQRLDGNMAQLLVFRPGSERESTKGTRRLQPDELQRTLPDDWEFSAIATRDNRWGEYRWPPTYEMIGPEIRTFRYSEDPRGEGIAEGWHQPECDDSAWALARYSMGPYWLCASAVAGDVDAETVAAADASAYAPGSQLQAGQTAYTWQAVEYSTTIGLAKPAPWGGHSGYPDGAIDQNFIELPEGRKLLFTRIHAPQAQRRGLRIELRNSSARVWVNGKQQPLEGAVANLPLRAGVNQVLVDVPDGGHGRLFVQAEPPSVDSLAAVQNNAVAPPFDQAHWIQASDSGSGFLRKEFTLPEQPVDAKVIVTGYTGYRLFINGKQVEEDIGPWAKWTHPESISATPYLRAGKNVIAAWLQVHSGQNVSGLPAGQALAFALQAKLPAGDLFSLVSDASWKREIALRSGWEQPDFDDNAWRAVTDRGAMGAEPYGNAPLQNVGAVTEPRRKLAIELPAPYLTCFEEVPDIAYDVLPADSKRIGWFRFVAPPGLNVLRLHTSAPAQVWVDGQQVPVAEQVATIANPPRNVSQVAVRMEFTPGAYAGAAFPLPIGLELEGGVIQPGLWKEFALPTYSGIGVYQQTLTLTEAEARRHTELDLGEVLVAAELLVNGKPAGVRLARPFRFDISQLLQAGDNRLEVRVANTLAPHYTETNEVLNLGPTDSGLLGPVVLSQQLTDDERVTWVATEIARLTQALNTSNAELEAAQLAWESTARWAVPKLQQATSTTGCIWRQDADGFICADEKQDGADTCELTLQTDQVGVTGLRLDWVSPGIATGTESAANGAAQPLADRVELVAELPQKARFQGRFVRLQIVDQTTFLHLAEVQVFSGERNIALEGKASQSSVSLDASADRAIDGNVDGQWSGNSVCHTNNEREPWWEIDLGQTQPIDKLVIWNRTDGELEERLVPLRITLLDDQREVVWQQVITQVPDPQATIHLSPVPVKLKLVGPPAGTSLGDGEPVEDPQLPATGGAAAETRHVSVWRVEPPLGFPGGTVLRLDLQLADTDKAAAAGHRFRVSTTTMSSTPHDIPPEITVILQQQSDQRQPQEIEQLATFYRSIAPQLLPLRQRLALLKGE